MFRRMVKQHQRHQTFNEYIKEYLRKCTINGIRHFASPRLHPFEIAVWAVVVTLAIYSSISIIYSNWERYKMNPIVESLEKDFREWEFENPAITACFLDKVDEVKAKTYIESTWGRMNSSMEAYYMKFIHTVMNMSFRQLSGFKEFAGDINLENINMLDLAKKVQYQTDINTGGKFQEQRFVGLKPIQTVNELGFCYSIVSVIQPKYQTVNASEPFDPERCRTGALCYFVTVIEGGRAMKFTIHSSYEIPDVANRFLLATSKVQTNKELGNLQFVSSRQLKQVEPKGRNCLFRDEGKAYNLPEYSYNACRMRCRRQLAINLCGCSPPFYEYLNAQSKDRVCNITEMVCILENSRELITLIDTIGERKDCSCFPTCEHTVFTIYEEYLTPVMVSNGKIGNMTIIRIGVSHFGKVRYRKDILFTFEDLLVSFGSTASFFLGCSILSFVELIYFFTLRILFYLLNKYRKINKALELRRHRFLISQNHQEIKKNFY